MKQMGRVMEKEAKESLRFKIVEMGRKDTEIRTSEVKPNYHPGILEKGLFGLYGVKR